MAHGPRLSYGFALTQPTNYFRGQIVFIGTAPKTSVPGGADDTDKFSTPYTRWTGESSGGVEILLDLLSESDERRLVAAASRWLEALMLVTSGLLLGGGLCRVRLPLACAIAVGVAVVVAFGAISWSYFTNYWFPWLVIVGGQVPCALGWALAMGIRRALEKRTVSVSLSFPRVGGCSRGHAGCTRLQIVQSALWRGRLRKSLAGTERSRAMAGVEGGLSGKLRPKYRPYEREFSGIKKYQPVSDKHPGLLRVEFVSEKRRDIFIMSWNWGTRLKPGWEQEPSTYKPRDLVSERARSQGGGCRCGNVCGLGWH